jgi:iron complex outermembrane recepter protein
MRTRTRRTIVVASAVLAATLLLPAVPRLAFAQQVERVEITGSSIRRTEAETAVPVQVITREEVEKTGATNVEQFMQALGVALQGNSNTVAASASGATTGGVSSISLRGLGSQRTLILIDGKRVSGGGTITDSTTVDVNMIPIAAIERIEVLRDGASAIYGSDAIAGVVNFILRKDYRGAEGTAFGGVTQHGGGTTGGLNGIVGWGDMARQGFNANLIADFRHEDPIFGRQRGFASSGIIPEHNNDVTSGNTFPANIFLPAPFGGTDPNTGLPVGTTRNPRAAFGCTPTGTAPSGYATLDPFFFGTRSCRFDPSPMVSLIPKTDQGSLFGNLRMRLTPAIEGYGQASYAHKEQNTIIQPVPLSDQFALPPNHPLFNVAPYNGFSTFLLTTASPYYPTAFVTGITGGATPDLLVRYRSAVTGNRDLTDISDQFRLVLGGRGTLGQSWDYDASALHIETNLKEHVNSGFPIQSKILPILNSGVINPFGSSDLTPGADASLEGTQFHGDAWKTKTSTDGLQAKVTHDLMRMAGGPLAVAVGAEGRKEAFKVQVADEIATGDVSGYGGNFFPITVHRKVYATFAEVNAPILRSLELTGAARYDDYSDVGKKLSPLFRARFQPVRQVVLRGTIAKGFRAPSLTELYQPQTTGVTANGLNDPLRCPTTGSSLDCKTQFPITLGGNTGLKPEESLNRTVGIVFEPTTNMSFGVDLWSVDLRNPIIFGVEPAATLQDPTRFGFLVTRAAPDPSCPGCPGRIINIDQRNLNLGEQKVRGVDVDARWRLPATAIGAFTVGFNGTYIDKYEIQQIDGTWQSINDMVSPIVNGAGGVIPRWRHFLTLDWKRNAWDVTLVQQYQKGYQDIPGTGEDPTDPAFVPHHVGDYTLYHLYTSYTGFYKKNLKLSFAIRNLFDKDPPYTNAGGQNYFQAGYDPGYADPRGRTFLLSATYKFK